MLPPHPTAGLETQPGAISHLCYNEPGALVHASLGGEHHSVDCTPKVSAGTDKPIAMYGPERAVPRSFAEDLVWPMLVRKQLSLIS